MIKNGIHERLDCHQIYVQWCNAFEVEGHGTKGRLN